MSSICVIGGTRFFGKIVVRNLLAQGHQVTVLTRGRASDDLGDAVHRLHADANFADALRTALAHRTFDAVLHQMCYSPIAALAACAAFEGRTGRLVMTSSIEVYNRRTFAGPASTVRPFARETDVDPSLCDFDPTLPWLDPVFAQEHYAEGKRQAEAALAQEATFPVAFVRVGHVLSDRDEFTGRFQFHVDRVLRGRTIKSWPMPGKTSFVHADDIAAFLAWMSQAAVTGPVNGCSPEGLSVYDLCAALELASGRKAAIEEVLDPTGDPDLSPFSCPEDFTMSSSLAQELGYGFTSAGEWLPRIAASAVARSRQPCSI